MLLSIRNGDIFFQRYTRLTKYLGDRGVIKVDYLKIAPFIVNWYFSIPRIAQHVWILAVLGVYDQMDGINLLFFSQNPYDWLRGL